MGRAPFGFTLVELLIVVTLIGILAAFAVPQYLRSIETSKADSAVALMNAVATANRMYGAAHGGIYVSGSLTNTACNTGGACLGNSSSVCELVRCRYLPRLDWDNNSYIVAADLPGGNVICGSAGYGGLVCGAAPAACIACVARKTASNCGSRCAIGVGTQTPYTAWVYAVNPTGQFQSGGSQVPNPVPQ